MAETKDYGEIVLDGKVRRLRYRWREIRELCRRCGGLTLQQLLARLGEVDPEVLTTAVHVGLRQDEKNITLDKIDELLDGFFRSGDEAQLQTLLAAVNDAIVGSGVLRDRSKPVSEEVRPT